jgi:protein gp37
MSEQTGIEWATATWNPWEGCTKVSPGCANCYAAARNQRFSKGANWGKGRPRRRTSAANWGKPLKWNRWAEDDSVQFGSSGPSLYPDAMRPRIFPSLCDWLDDEVPIAWLADFLKLIHDTPNLDWLLLTKRPENFQRRMTAVWEHMPFCAPEKIMVMKWSNAAHMAVPDGFHLPPANVWVGTSVEDQAHADKRIPKLLGIPAAVRFLSVEPLLGPVDLHRVQFPRKSGGTGPENVLIDPISDHAREWIKALREMKIPKVDWVIIGGESGPGSRVCNAEWVRALVNQCAASGAACFVKQFGSNCVSGVDDFHCAMSDIGRDDVMWKAHLKHSKGGDPSEWPEDLRVRQFPKSEITKA